MGHSDPNEPPESRPARLDNLHRLEAVGLGEKVLVMAVAHIQCEGGAYYGPHETRTKYPINTKNGNAMAYDASIGKALWEASEKAVVEGLKL